MFENARLTRGSDRVEGDYISYNIKSEFFQIMGGGKSSSGDAKSSGRVRAIIQPKEENLNPIRNMTEPRDVSHLRAFLGCCQQLSSYTKDYAIIAHPLHQLQPLRRPRGACDARPTSP